MRLRLTVAYDGTAFSGFQRQAGPRTVQACLEEAIFALTGERVAVRGAGRTDSGVHAEGQVAVFDPPERPWTPERWLLALNGRLPRDVRVREAAWAPPTFDPQRQALAKEYRYLLDPSPVPLPWHEPYSLHVRWPVDWARVEEALSLLEGRHDFQAFAGAKRSVRTTVRTLFRARLISRPDGLWAVRFVGDGFLNHQCRIMVGTVLEVGSGRRPLASVAEALASGRREHAGVTAKAKGLTLVRVYYDRDELDRALRRPDNT